jgi:hypothetical protein
MKWVIVIVACAALYIYFRFTSGRKTNAPLGDLPGPGAYGVDIVGESHYQSASANMWWQRRGECSQAGQSRARSRR